MRVAALLTLLAIALPMSQPAPALAQTPWPAHPLTYVVPYPPGGTTDIIGRTLAQHIGTALGTTVVVENKPGATGTIGGAFVARAAPDGYTLLGTSIGPQAIVPHLIRLPYDAAAAYEPVTLVGTVPHLLLVRADAPYATVRDLVAAAKARPGRLSFASGGNGTILQMQGELLKQQAGIDMIHVPYKGDTPALQDVMGGQATMVFAPVAAALPLVRSGKLKALAVTSAQRLPSLPAVPTMAEAGWQDFVVEQWQAVYLPAGTPKAIVGRVDAEIRKALTDPQVVEAFGKLGVTIVGGGPEQLAARQKQDSARWAQVVKTAGVKLD